MTIAEFVKKRRREEGLNQRKLAELSGVGLRFVRELEQGKTTLQTHKVNAVLKLFGKKLGPVNLFEEEGDQ
ncbi:MAG: helix-turn-helix transcriptional regulator [Deltaproteobacteria bacterium]|nr:helix-turn-helix transcriptional regulator [Deltaproteobacteria bacterium]